MGARNFEILVEDSDTVGPSSIAVRIECLFMIFVPTRICELRLKNDFWGVGVGGEGGRAESIIK